MVELTAQTPFGAFTHLDGRRELWFQHAILGDDLDRVELEAAIGIVASSPTAGTTGWPRSSAACATQTSAELLEAMRASS